MSLASDIDDRTVKQQLEDLNVEVIRSRPTISGVQWAERGKISKPRKRKPKTPFVRFMHYGIYFSVDAARALAPVGKHYSFGVADYTQRGKTIRVLLLREAEKGYKISLDKKRRIGMNQTPGLRHQLATQGLQYGKYELVKVNDGWMGVPM